MDWKIGSPGFPDVTRLDFWGGSPLSDGPLRVEWGCGAVTVGRTYLLPPLSSGGASLVRPWLRFHTPLIERGVRISPTTLSDKTSRLRPRHVVPKPGQPYEPEVPVEVRKWITSAPAASDLVLEAQPPAQPHSRVVVERPIRTVDGANTEVVGPSPQRAVHFPHQLCGLLPCLRSGGERVDCLDRALDALLRWPLCQACLAGFRRIHPPERIPQEVKLAFRHLADACLLLVDRQLQLAHDLPQSVQRRFGFAPPAQNHEVVRVGHDARAEASLQPELLPSQHKPAHVEIRQQ